MRQTTKEKQRQWRWAHTEDPLDWIETMSWDRSQANFCLVSLSHPHCFRSNDLFSPPLFFFFFSPPVFIWRVLLFIIRLDASPGVSYFSHSFNIFRGRHLFACLFVCFFPEVRLSYRLRFSIRHGTTIYYGVIFYYKNETKKYENKKKWFCSIDIAANRGIMGYRIGSGSAAGEQWVGFGWVWFLDGWWTFVFGLSCFACLLACFLDWICLLCCCCLSLWGSLLLSASFRTYIPWSRLTTFLWYSCSIPTYPTYY